MSVSACVKCSVRDVSVLSIGSACEILQRNQMKRKQDLFFGGKYDEKDDGIASCGRADEYRPGGSGGRF
jgi:hypothetical protein